MKRQTIRTQRPGKTAEDKIKDAALRPRVISYHAGNAKRADAGHPEGRYPRTVPT